MEPIGGPRPLIPTTASTRHEPRLARQSIPRVNQFAITTSCSPVTLWRLGTVCQTDDIEDPRECQEAAFVLRATPPHSGGHGRAV